MSAEYTRADRAYLDGSAADLYQQLKREATTLAEEAPFDTYKDLFMLAACLGYREGRRTKLTNRGAEVPVRTFTDEDMAMLKALAIAETGDVSVLARLPEIIGIAEEYAHVGIHEVRGYLIDEGGRPLWNLVNLLT